MRCRAVNVRALKTRAGKSGAERMRGFVVVGDVLLAVVPQAQFRSTVIAEAQRKFSAGV